MHVHADIFTASHRGCSFLDGLWFAPKTLLQKRGALLYCVLSTTRNLNILIPYAWQTRTPAALNDDSIAFASVLAPVTMGRGFDMRYLRRSLLHLLHGQRDGRGQLDRTTESGAANRVSPAQSQFVAGRIGHI